MKTLIYLIFSFILIGKIQAQEATPNKKDSKNVRQGHWTLFLTENGQETTTKDSIVFYSIGEMKDGLWNGLCVDYDAKTKFKKAEINYLNGKANGLAIIYDDNEKKSAKGEFLDDKKNGLWSWYYPNGKIQVELTYLNGKRNGKHKVWNEKGEITAEHGYEDDELTEINGLTLLGTIYKWEILNAEGEELYKAGKYIEAIAAFESAKAQIENKFGKKHNNYITCCGKLVLSYQKQSSYAKAEALFIEIKDITAQMLGKEHIDYANACNNLADLYKQQGLHSKATPLFAEAKDIRKKFRQGRATIYYNENGQETTAKDSIFSYSVGEMKDGLWNGLRIDYDAKTKLKKAEINYLNGKANGLAIFYDDNEKKSAKGEFLDDKKNGLWNWYYPSGKMESECTFLNGKKEGKYKKWNEKGGTLEQEDFENGERKKNMGGLVLLGTVTMSKAEQKEADAASNVEAEKLYEAGKYTEALVVFERTRSKASKELGKQHPDYIQSCRNLAEFYSRQNLDLKEELLYVEIKDIIRNKFGKEHADYATSCNDLANLYKKQGFYSKAEPLYLEVREIRAKVLGKEHKDYINSSNALAHLYENQGFYSKAEPLLIEVKGITEKTVGKEDFNYTYYCRNLAKLYNKQGFYSKATPLYIEIREVTEKTLGTEHRNYAVACDDLASAYLNQRFYSKAEPLLIEAKDIREKEFGKKHLDYAISCNELGTLYLNQGFYSKAEALVIEAKNIREEKLGIEHPTYVQSCNLLAIIYQNQGIYSETEELLKETKYITEKVLGKETSDYANYCGNLANLYLRQGFYSQATPLLIESKDITEKVLGKEHPNYAHSCNDLGVLYENQGLYAKAESLYIEAKSIFEKVLGKEHPNYASSCNNLAKLYEKQGFYAKATPLFIEASQIDIQQIATNFSHLSEKEKDVYFNTFSYHFEHYNLFTTKAFKEIPSLNAWAFNNSLATKGLLFSSTQKMRERIMNSNDPTLKKLYENWKNARTEYSKALQINEKERKKANISTEKLQTEANELEKQLSRKSELFAKATDKTKSTWQDVQKNLKKEEVIVEIIRLEEPKKIKIFDFIGNGFSRILMNSGNYQIQEIRGEDTPAYRAGMRAGDIFLEVNGKIVKGKPEQEVDKIFVDAKGTATTFKMQSLNNAKEIEIKTITVKADSLFDTKTIYEPSYMALIITPTTQNQPEMVVLANGNEMEKENVSYYKNAIKFKKEDKISYNAFWRDIKAKLGDAKKVYFVPDGVYHQINLLTLQNPSTKAYLRSEMQVQLLSSSKDLIKYAENAKKQRKNFKDYQIHLFGYPNYAQKGEKKPTTKEERSLSFSAKMDTTQRFFDATSGVITVLEGTKVEINNISKILTDKNIKNTSYLENKADEGTIKALKNADILHIATHGFFLGDTEKFDKDNADKFRENPLLRSGLLLKDAEKGMRGEILEGEDGVLTAQEAINLNLDDTELVVMSACETGLGEIKNGEGVYGLQRSFQQAGAKTILMSLWKVDDVATQEVMTLFYNNLVAGKTKRQAFDDAQETLYQKYKNPYFWGAFVMVGE